MSKEAMKLAMDAKIHKAGMNPIMQGPCYLMHPDALQAVIDAALREALAVHPAQRTWVSLTEDEISLIVAECSLVSPSDHYFAEAIEAKLKEKNT